MVLCWINGQRAVLGGRLGMCLPLKKATLRNPQRFTSLRAIFLFGREAVSGKIPRLARLAPIWVVGGWKASVLCQPASRWRRGRKLIGQVSYTLRCWVTKPYKSVESRRNRAWCDPNLGKTL